MNESTDYTLPRICEWCRELTAFLIYGTIGTLFGLVIGLWIRGAP